MDKPLKKKLPNEILNRAKSGDEEALKLFCHWSEPFVKSALVGLEAEFSQIEDLAQDSMLRILKGLPNLKHNKAILSLIFKCTRGAWIDHLRKKYKSKKVQFISREEFNKYFLEDSDPEKLTCLELMIQETLRNMPLHLRELFLLWKIKELNAKEIAEKFNISHYYLNKWKAKLMRRLQKAIF